MNKYPDSKILRVGLAWMLLPVLRAGVRRNALSFGLGTNLAQYGPEKSFKENYGVFVKWDLK